MLFKWFSRLYHTIVFMIFLGIFVHIFAPILVEASPIPNVFINEIHYDNIGKDVDEIIEIVGEADIDLTTWSLHLYNGVSGSEYNTFNLGAWSAIDNHLGILAIEVVGLQNGSPDGIVLSDGLNVLQFLSYEGAFTATSGIANGLTSTDIGVFESSKTPLGLSLQLTGRGSKYSDFTWAVPQKSSFLSANINQNFITNKVPLMPVNEPNTLLIFCAALLALLLKHRVKNSR